MRRRRRKGKTSWLLTHTGKHTRAGLYTERGAALLIKNNSVDGVRHGKPSEEVLVLRIEGGRGSGVSEGDDCASADVSDADAGASAEN